MKFPHRNNLVAVFAHLGKGRTAPATGAPTPAGTGVAAAAAPSTARERNRPRNRLAGASQTLRKKYLLNRS